jgi:glycogen synthase
MLAEAPDISQQPIKILMTADAVGGVWQYTVDLIRGLGKNAEVLLATFGPRPSQEQKEQLANLPQVQLRESGYALEWMSDPWRDIDAAGQWLLSLQSEFQADIVHLNGYTHAALPWGIPVLVVAHSCVYSWWHAVHNCAPSPEWNEYYRRVANGLSICDVVVAPSRFMADEVEREYSIRNEKIQVIYNFSAAPCSFGMAKEPFCLAAGRLWDKAKNLSVLAEIAPHLHWPIYLAGDEKGPETPVAVPDSLHLLGYLPNAELLGYMSRASIFLHPALYEPFGLSVLEAARCGCCLVLADIPSFRELWSESAVFIDGRKPENWIREVNQLAANPERVRRLGDAASSHAARYSRENSIEAYQNLYRSLKAQASCRETRA